jgi:hypothetical protein
VIIGRAARGTYPGINSGYFKEPGSAVMTRDHCEIQWKKDRVGPYHLPDLFVGGWKYRLSSSLDKLIKFSLLID